MIDPFSAELLDKLVKECVEAEHILQDCGRIRLQRTLAAAWRLFQQEQADEAKDDAE